MSSRTSSTPSLRTTHSTASIATTRLSTRRTRRSTCSSRCTTAPTELKRANYVAVATETTDPSPSGTHGRYQLQTTVSVRLEGLTSAEWGPHRSRWRGRRRLFRPVRQRVRGHHFGDVLPRCRPPGPDVSRPDHHERQRLIVRVLGLLASVVRRAVSRTHRCVTTPPQPEVQYDRAERRNQFVHRPARRAL